MSFSTETETQAHDQQQFRVPTLNGRIVQLRPVVPEDYHFLRLAELSGQLSVRWRFRGATPSPEQWVQNLWQSTLAQYVVVAAQDPRPIGLVAAYHANFQDGYAFIAAETFAEQRPAPLMIFGIGLFLDYVFTCWNFHKLYMEVAEYNLPQFRSGIGRFFEVEGRLRQHFWYDERRWDQLVLAIYRDTWRREARRLLHAALPAPERRAHVRMPAAREEV